MSLCSGNDTYTSCLQESPPYTMDRLTTPQLSHLLFAHLSDS